jgi:ATP-dependent exoDNAse (exonuclease V) alpha subunit
VVACSAADRSLVVHFPHLGGGVEGRRRYAGVEVSQLELGYAVTVHKAQGGEAAHVVLALAPQHGRMLTRRLLYTGGWGGQGGAGAAAAGRWRCL